MALIAPGVHVYWSEKDSESRMEDQAVIRQRLRETETGSKIVSVGRLQAARISVLASDKCRRHAIVEDQVRVGIADVHQRIHEFIAQAHFNGRGARKPETVLRKAVGIPLP